MEALKSEVLNSPCCQPSPLFDNIPTRVPKLSSVSVGGKELMPVIKIGFDNGAEYAFHNDDIQEMFLDWLTAVGVEHICVSGKRNYPSYVSSIRPTPTLGRGFLLHHLTGKLRIRH
jgi:hypothetical protein